MIEGAKYEIWRPQDSNLGWRKIQFLERRAIGAVTTKLKNETRTSTQFEWVVIADSDLVVLSEDDVHEDLAQHYEFIEIEK